MLDNAINPVETERLNSVSELTFALPADDPKNKYCKPFQLVRWGNGQFYRILDAETESDLTQYTCEHSIATLIDDVIFGTVQYDNLTTKEVLSLVLDRQMKKHWVLGDCDFVRRFSYNWSNENLLAALFSVPNRLDEDYQWVFDTTHYPWTVHLRKLCQTLDPQYYLRKNRNLISATKSSKGRDICTRIYPLGYGEGVNQLKIEGVNHNVPYLQADDAAVKQYGLITRIWEDRRFTDPEALKQRAAVLLNGYAKPYESYSVQASALDQRTSVAVGKIVWYEGFKSYITEVVRHLAEIGQDTLQLANTPEDIASSIADLADRQRINSVYAQGATNIYAQSYADNANPQNPATIKFYIPSEAVHINKVILTWSIESFRAYSTGASTTETTSRSTTDGGGSSSTSSTGGGSNSSSGSSSVSSSREAVAMGNGTNAAKVYPPNGNLSYELHTHLVEYMLLPHYHNIEHTHQIYVPEHAHSISIPKHSHQITVPGHNHKIEYGIYQGPRAKTVAIKVDGKAVSIDTTQKEVDLANYLGTDTSGKISRGTYHTIEIIPDGLTRISAAVTVQLFIQSYGGGNY